MAFQGPLNLLVPRTIPEADGEERSCFAFTEFSKPGRVLGVGGGGKAVLRWKMKLLVKTGGPAFGKRSGTVSKPRAEDQKPHWVKGSRAPRLASPTPHHRDPSSLRSPSSPSLRRFLSIL